MTPTDLASALSRYITQRVLAIGFWLSVVVIAGLIATKVLGVW